jgi:hypothetical protein
MIRRFARLRPGRWLLTAVLLGATASAGFAGPVNRGPPLLRPGLPPLPVVPFASNTRPPDLDLPRGFQAAASGNTTTGTTGTNGAAAAGGLAGGGLAAAGGLFGGGMFQQGIGGAGGLAGGAGGLGGGFKNFGFGGAPEIRYRPIFRSSINPNFGKWLEEAEEK